MVTSLMERTRAKYVRRANVPPRFDGQRLDSLDIPTSIRLECDVLVKRVVENGQPIGKGLMLFGAPGRGKSTIAVATLIEILQSAPREYLGKHSDSDAMRPGYYVPYAELIRIYHKSWRPGEDDAYDLLQSLYGASRYPWWDTRVLVLDDVGKEHSGPSGFTASTLHDLLRSRYDKGFPTIITTNLRPDDFTHEYGDAMASFIHEAFTIVSVGGKDRRR